MTYEGFSAERPLQGSPAYVSAARQLASELGVSGVLAVEAGSLPAALAEALSGRIASTVPIDRELARARMVKTEDEIAALRRASAVADAGQRVVRRSAQAGRSELELFAVIRYAMEKEAGGRCCVAGECSSGSRADERAVRLPAHARAAGGRSGDRRSRASRCRVLG